MQSRRDRVMAHTFTVGRLGTAMLEADPDAVDAPMRRTRTGTYVGVAIAALVCVGFLVFGLIFPGGAGTWRQEGRLVIDKESGASYLYSAGTLRPVANHASALLIQGPDANVSLVSAASLEGVPVGGPVGIPGAPDSLPGAEALAAGVWRLCALPAQADERPRTALTIGTAPDPSPPADDEAVLVAGPDGGRHLLWQGTRLRLDEDGGAVQALGYGTSPAYAVSGAFLDAVPTAPDLTAPDVAQAGADGPSLAGAPRRVGQVFAVSTPDRPDQHYLLTTDGLAPLTLTQALLLLADPDHSGTAYPDTAPEAIAIPAGEAHDHLVAGGEVAGDGAARTPDAPPELRRAGGEVPCLRLSDGGTLSLTMDEPESVQALPVQEVPAIAPGCPTPDLIGIPSGGGSVVRATPADGGTNTPTHYLVTDAAAKYPVTDTEVLEGLGLTAGSATEVPTPLLRLMPTGPVLHPEAAARPLTPSVRAESAECP
ncbi:type VII secretion protein EccB [Nocardiopsis sp. Huas11]|uniref:type VII secretion protein EccB n=1 Tax=Nocardiopsis sp. Huas11 TaxID=2183912 RepID=UPI000EB3D3B9|nr:type VII secretion protein EccB [Nocardiopsis sp. Huas11]RKS08296.1 type VII secretion protein EccB [Nocardiopsis sp. Huas11]